MLVDAVSFNSYRLRSATQTMGLHMAPSQSHATILALASKAAQPRQQGEQVGVQAWRRSCCSLTFVRACCTDGMLAAAHGAATAGCTVVMQYRRFIPQQLAGVHFSTLLHSLFATTSS